LLQTATSVYTPCHNNRIKEDSLSIAFVELCVFHGQHQDRLNNANTDRHTIRLIFPRPVGNTAHVGSTFSGNGTGGTLRICAGGVWRMMF